MALKKWKHVRILKLFVKLHTAELLLPGVTGMERHPDLQKIRIIGFFFGNRLHW